MWIYLSKRLCEIREAGNMGGDLLERNLKTSGCPQISHLDFDSPLTMFSMTGDGGSLGFVDLASESAATPLGERENQCGIVDCKPLWRSIQ